MPPRTDLGLTKLNKREPYITIERENVDRSLFLRLPADVRRLIFHAVFSGRDVNAPYYRYLDPTNYYALVRVCRQTYSEIGDLPYRFGILRLHFPLYDFTRLDFIRAHVLAVQHIHCDYSSISVKNDWNMQGEVPYALLSHLSRLSCFKNMKDLRINAADFRPKEDADLEAWEETVKKKMKKYIWKQDLKVTLVYTKRPAQPPTLDYEGASSDEDF